MSIATNRRLSAVMCFLSLLFAAQLRAQTNQNTGFPGPTDGSVPVQFGSVNTSNGNLILTIPLGSIPQRKGAPTTVNLVYNSSFWMVNSQGFGNTFVYPANPANPYAVYLGFSVVTDTGDAGELYFDTSSNFCGAPPTGPPVGGPGSNVGAGETGEVTFSNFSWHDLYGGSVPFYVGPFTQDYDCDTNRYPVGTDSQGRASAIGRHFNGPLYSFGIQFNPNAGGIAGMEVWDQSGDIVSDNSRKDTNGNFSQLGVDQLNRNVSAETCQNPAWASQGGTCTLNILTSSGPVSYTIQYSVEPICSNFSYGPTVTQYCGNVVLPTQVTRPDGTNYVFTWDTGSSAGHYGTLTDIQLPEGGHLHYTYSVQTIDSNPISVQSVSDGHGTTTFAYNQNASGPSGMTASSFLQTTVTHPQYIDQFQTAASDQTVHLYANVNSAQSGCPGGCTVPLLIESDKYSDGGALSESKIYDWNIPQGSQSFGYNAEQIDDSQVRTVTTYRAGRNTDVTSYQNMLGTDLPTLLEKNGVRTTVITYVNDTNNNGTPYNSAYHMYNLAASEAVFQGTATSGTPIAFTSFVYDEYSSNFCQNSIPGLKVISGASGHDDTYGASYIARGNITTRNKLIGGTTYATNHSCYDTLGNVTQTVDPNGNPTTFDYADAWYDSGATVANTYSAPTTITNAKGQVTKNKYWSNSSLLAQTQNPNDLTASRSGTLYTYDFIGRSTQVTSSDGGWTSTTYTDGPTSPQVLTKSCRLNCVSGTATTVDKLTLLDDLGRPTRTELLTARLGTIYQDVAYDGNGRIMTKSNPYYSTSDPTYGITSFTYDVLGRPVSQTKPDGNQQTWFYYGGPDVQFTDESGKSWWREYDGLGRLVAVGEPGIYTAPTTYSYDALDNLQCVDQWGWNDPSTPCTSSLTRSFTYDSLSRLVTSTNPETGTICYGTVLPSGQTPSPSNCSSGYDSANNLLHRTDADGNQLDYTYDTLNRLVQQNSADPNAVFHYDYDQGTNGIGQLSDEYNPNGLAGTSFGYDPLGRVTGTNWFNYAASSWVSGVGAQYDFLGNPTQITYPHGRVLRDTYDGAGWLLSVTDQTPGIQSVPYISSLTYTAVGSLSQATYGNGVTETTSFNSRLQPCKTFATSPLLPTNTHLYDRQTYFSSPDPSLPCGAEGANNGNIYAIIDNLQSGLTQRFGYDGANRLNTAYSQGGTFNHTYNIDPVGNMLLQDNQHTNLSYGIDAATSRMTLNGDLQTGDLRYDASGHMVSSPGHTFSWTADGNLRSIDNYSTGSYLYNGSGQRTLAVHNNSSWNEYVYLAGVMLADLDGNGTWTDYIYSNGQKIAKVTTPTSGTGVTRYYLNDHLGTTQMELDASANVTWQGQFTPYGQEIIGGTTTNYLGPQPADGTDMRFKFTGKERDAESGLDYFGARFYASLTGRFISSDWSAKPETIPYANLEDPQTLNLYAYARNNPLAFVDPDGHAFCEDARGIPLPCAAPEATLSPSLNTTDPPQQSQQHVQNASQTKRSILPQNPTGLGPEWVDVTPQGGTNPKIPRRFRGPNGVEIEFDPANPDKAPTTEGGKDHWHVIDPGTGKRVKTGPSSHLQPGEEVPGTEQPEPEPEPGPKATEPATSQRSVWGRVGDFISDHKKEIIVGVLIVGAVAATAATGGAAAPALAVVF